MMAAMVGLFCDSFDQVPRRILLDIDDTEDRVHGGQQLALFNAHYDSRCFLPIHVYEATSVSLRGRPPFLSGQDRRRLDFDFRRGDEKCPQVWLWAQVWESGGVTGRGLRL
jgi:hypothetical protein